jgi:hypothetical protein
MPSASAISRMVWPCERRAWSLVESIETGLRPTRNPLARRLAIPALTRSRIRSRSNSANDATMLNINRPAGVVRSKLSRKLTKAMPSASNSPSVWGLCEGFEPT